jgi:predicted 2-oxoglutarate/Fe(II)-dependent dioxygenase YbiX
MQRTDHGERIHTLHPVLSEAECAAFIRRAEEAGFDTATINGAQGVRVDTRVRNNDRAMIRDEALAAELWARVRGHLPATLGKMRAIGLNELFRFYRYAPGQRFAEHVDGAYQSPRGPVSMLTFMIYLNEGYAGGATRFGSAEISGRAGMALVFDHRYRHEGAVLESGVKYVLRSDVMFEFAPQGEAP